ncbi:MAG: ABC transporter permease [Clostridiales Family XIII bacterium]|jgi:simple sugar transport system permease protein|nr:ABC transporter permease [Clostridiales Family XIII bacterium]
MFRRIIGNNNYLNVLLSVVVAFAVGAVILIAIGENPIEVYRQLLKCAFVGQMNFGGTLEKFVPIFITAIAFYMASVVKLFNVGVEGQMYLGAIASAWVGFTFAQLPAPLHMLMCFAFAVLAGGVWALISGVLAVRLKVNEICTTILLNYVAILITQYLVNGPLSAGTGISITPPVADQVKLAWFFESSKANTGLFVAIGIFALMFFMLRRTTAGFKLRNTGANPVFSEYIGIKTGMAILAGMFISGGIAGIAGCVQVLGVHHAFLNGFSSEIGFFGMLAALISKGDIKMLPIMSFLIAFLRNGALGMQRFTGMESSLVDIIITLFILITSMDWIINFFKERKQGAVIAPGNEVQEGVE